MRASSTTYLAAGAALLSSLQSVSAFLNTSPFFLITSSDIPKTNLPTTSTTTLTTSQFYEVAKDVISLCNSDGYVIATQPGVHASDFRNEHAGFSTEPEGTTGMLHLKRALYEEGGKRQLVVPFARRVGINGMEVEGDKGKMASLLGEWAKRKCGAEVVEVDASTGTFEKFGDMKPKVMMVNFEPLDEEDAGVRAKELANTDAFLFSLLESFPTSRYTLIYTSTPRSHPASNAPSKLQGLHTPQDELRRRSPSTLEIEKKKEGHNATIPTNGSLFQKYAFFTPGIFTGYIAAFFLLSIVYVGLSALMSLKVSYGAFEKEMGPAAAKKQQ